ncbi:MAG: PD-(D/E)XK nuclease family protein [Enterococcus sp.]
MTLQFVLGTGKTDHQQILVQEASQWLSKNKKNEVYFLVPNYNKFEQEQSLLAALREEKKKQELAEQPVYSSTRTQIFSFYRLAWFFLEKTTLLTGDTLTETGSAMLFRQVLEQNKEALTVFRGEINKKGFIQQLQDLYKELQSGNVQPEDLILTNETNTAKAEDQQLKMKDLQLIFRAFETELLEHNLQSEDILTTLSSYLEQQDLSHVKFFVTGFSKLNAQEFHLLSILMHRGALVVDLLLDRQYPDDFPQPLDLFAETGALYFKLYQIAAQNKVHILRDMFAQQKEQPHELLALQNSWIQSMKQEKIQKYALGTNDVLRIWSAENPTEEVRHLAVEIRRLISETDLRYRDIQVLTKNMGLYGNLIRPIFQEFAIPYYIDEEQMMENHPLVEWIKSLFSLDRYYYRLDDVMRFYKTELFIPQTEESDLADWATAREQFRKKIDLAENAALAYNYQGAYWVNDTPWQFVTYDFEAGQLEDVHELEEIVNQVRQLFQQQLPTFFEKIKTSKTGKDAARYFYQFLLTSGVQTQLLHWRDQEVERGNLAEARNHEQTWSALMDLLDEFAVIYENTAFDWETFQDIITSGLENLSYGKIPTAIDQVRINRLELARSNQAKVSFAVGLNSQVFPARMEEQGLLSSEERQRLNDSLPEDSFLFDPTKDAIAHEPFQAYLVYLSATDKLYLSYAQSYDTESSIQLSPYVQRISTMLDIPIEEKQHLTIESDPVDFVGTFRNLISVMNRMYRIAADDKESLPSIWMKLEKALLQSDWKELALRVFESQTYLNIPDSLPKPVAEKLYGKDLYTSISRMENFYNCEYKYFVQFGLKLKERNVYGLTPAATGDFYHESLDRFFKLLFSNQLSLTSMDEKQLRVFTEQVLQEVFGELRFNILDSSARMNYIRYQLEHTIQKVAWALQKQSHNTGMNPLQTEILFGQIAGAQGIPGLELPLENGGKLHVRGKIDRVDTAVDKEQTWLSVVDYKSSARQFDVTEAYYGMAMQLLTYLDVALMDAVRLTGQAKVKPAGSYYLHVFNPTLDEDKSIEKETIKKFKYDGLFVDDPALFEVMDHSLEAKESSLVYPIKKNAKDLYQKTSKDKFFTEDELQQFMAHNRKKMKLAGDAITSGEIKLNPAYKDKERIACQYCPFRSVCTFDVMLKENNYHRLEKLDTKEAIRRMNEGEETHD